MKSIFYSLTAIILLASCGTGSDPVAEKAKQDSIEKVAARGKYYQDVLNAEKNLDPKKSYSAKAMNEALRAYSAFVTNYPNDSMTPEYYFRAADLSQGLGNYPQSAAYLEVIIDKHKGYKRYPDALFAAANVYDTYLENVNHGDDRAKQLYQFIIDKYPTSSYAENSAVLIGYVGKPDSVLFNDIINKAEKNLSTQPTKGK
jgi:tetratricopeptide (TPR) repeat protein